jgi:DNA-binding CsgD family transcriptional regulator
MTVSLPEHRSYAAQAARPRPVAELAGRSTELELIDSLLAGPCPDGRGLLLRGDPGVGKTALLDAAAAGARAAGMRVLRASGVKFEAGMPFSALHQMLYPLRDHADLLAGHQYETLHRLFDLVAEPLPDALTASAAVLALLGVAAAERPLLMIADDVQWMDRASTTALAFVARRVAGAPILLLAAARPAADRFADRLRLPDHDVRPLALKASAKLLDSRWPGLAPAVRRRLFAEAGGNPLVLRDLPGALTDRQRSGRDPLPALMPLSGRLEAAFADGIAGLPDPTRRLLLLAALEPDAGPDTLRMAAQGAADLDDLAPARRANVLRAEPAAGRVVFRHPLIRSAITGSASASDIRGAHQALAAALVADPERRAGHLAEAATGPDEAVARALDEAGLSAWRRGTQADLRRNAADRRRIAASAAVAALVRAGELSPHPADRSRRLVEAAYLATITGQLDNVPRLLASAGQSPDTPAGLVLAATAHLLTNDEGDVDAAYRLLVRALDDIAGTTADWDHCGIMYALLLVSLYSRRPEPWDLLKTAMARSEPEDLIPFQLCYDAYVDPTHAPDAVREGLARAFAALPDDAAPWQIIPLAFAAVAMDTLADYRCQVQAMVEREREDGAIAMVIPGLMLLSHDSYVRGRWDEAERLAREGLELAAVYGYHFWAGQLRALLASGAALRGDVDLAQARSEATTTWAVPRGIGVAEAYARSARHLAAMGQGDFEEAHVQVSRIDRPGTPSAGVPGRWLVLDVVEAAVRTGRVEEARAHVAAARQAGIDRISPRIALITAGAAALAADDADADALFETALSLPDAAHWPWEHARVQLAYGQWLRRARETADARGYLRAALETFDRIGAAAMAQRARGELRATGLTTTRPGAAGLVLTPQERQIAELAAAGLTNKEIGERLFLSHRTISSHLYHLYPKFGITSRSALGAALATMPADDRGQALASPESTVGGLQDQVIRPAPTGSYVGVQRHPQQCGFAGRRSS